LWPVTSIAKHRFNALNRVNFDMPQNFAAAPSTFGRIFSAKASRQIQFALSI